MRVHIEVDAIDMMGPLARLSLVREDTGEKRVIFDCPLNDQHNLVRKGKSDELAWIVCADALQKALAAPERLDRV